MRDPNLFKTGWGNACLGEPEDAVALRVDGLESERFTDIHFVGGARPHGLPNSSGSAEYAMGGTEAVHRPMKIAIGCDQNAVELKEQLEAFITGLGHVCVDFGGDDPSYANTASVVEAPRIAHERGAITIGITASAKSPLLKYCSYALSTGTVDETDTGDMITRCIAEQTVLETFYLCAVDDDGKDLEEVKKQGAKAIEQMTKQDGGTKA